MWRWNPVDLARETLLSAAGLFIRYRIGIGFYIRVRARDRERLPGGPFLLCSNHASHLDYIALVEALGISHDEIIAIAAADFHFDQSTRARLFQRLFNLAPLERGNSLASVRRCSETCQRFIAGGGKVILVYPEGTRSGDGRIRPFKHGFTPIAAELGLPIVPAHVEGGFRMFSKHHVIPRPGRLDVRFGYPIEMERGADGAVKRLTGESSRALAARIETAVRELAGQAA